MARPLTTFDAVIEALGGLACAARVLGRTPANLCQWRQRLNGRFPAETYFVIRTALNARGYAARRDLFRFDDEEEAAHKEAAATR